MMRCLRRNMQSFYYASYVGKHPIHTTDDYGNEIQSSEYAIEYSDPVLSKANITPARGVTATQLFGTADDYDKVLMMDDPNVPIDEYAVLWIDVKPFDGNERVPHDYIVKRVARSLNSVAIAVSKVNVRYG